nr:retrovirus-related Pol polyprotein from transposon TNT 1-94 [Tanacetum cinerariifolium]
MFMLGPSLLFVYDQQLKHGLGYSNPYTFKKAIYQCPRSMNGGSHDKNSVLAIAKNSAKQVAVYVRKNKQTDNTLANVISNKQNVIDVDVANASKAKNLLCVSCMKNVLFSCHDKCLVNHRLNMHLNARRTLSTKPRMKKSSDTTYVGLKTRFSDKLAESKTLDTTFVVSKPNIDVGSASKAQNKVSSAPKTNIRDFQNKSLSRYMKNKIRTSQISQKWFESRPNVVSSPVNTNSFVHNSGSSKKPSVLVKNSGCSKHMAGDRSLLRNFIKKFMSTVRFGNDNFATITGYCNYIQGNITICHVYYVEGLGHNLFSIGQFCDGDLEVTFRSKTCYVRNLEGDDFLTEGRESNLYTISISDMAASSLVYFLHSKDETPDIIKKFIAQAQLNYKAKICKIRTDNGIKFKNANLKAYYEKLGIMQQFSNVRTPQQNGVVKRCNRTLVEAARTMLIFSRLPEFLGAEEVAAACFTQNQSIIHTRYNKTPYEILRGQKSNVEYFYVFGSLCYPTNNCDDLGKMKPKADIGVFIGYSKTSRGFRIYNRRTKKIMETIHVKFDELRAMTYEHDCLEPEHQ